MLILFPQNFLTMLKRSYSTAIILLITSLLWADTSFSKEGMWQPTKLKRQESTMQKLGLKIPVEKIYNENGTGLNNAVVIFGSGCTGEIISNNGLLLTNHHCGYSNIQALSTVDHNYLVDGFWAMNHQEEIPSPGLTATFVRKTEEVTDYILEGLSDTMNQEKRDKVIQERIVEVQDAYEATTKYKAEVKPFYEGNQYWVTLTETFKDVRLVGTPPNGIGKFGADTDNWMWPRMTGDFSIFRVYASPDNQPADYDVNNVPYKTKTFFSISTSGYKEGDFTMVYGFPYTTREYISSFQLAEVEQIMDPIRIESRKARLEALDKRMRNDPEVFLKYAAKQSSISNGYKKWQGELQGLAINDVMGKKQEYEREFQLYATASPKTNEDKMILPRIKAAVNGNKNALIANEYIRETVMGVEAIQQAGILNNLLMLYRNNATGSEKQTFIDKTNKNLENFYKNYDAPTDQQVFLAAMPVYLKQSDAVVSPELKKIYFNAGNDLEVWADYLFQETAVVDPKKMYDYLNNGEASDTFKFKADPAYQIYSSVTNFKKESVDPAMHSYQKTMKPLNYLYMKRQLEYLNSGRDFYPDANQTLRLTYGQVESINLGTSNQYQTTLDDLMPRHNSKVEEFNIPERLRTIYEEKDYGRWQTNGSVPINFIASNHTSGGNSGSPVLNGKGELIGLNFDRIWQGTMSDLYFDPNLCRNISVDIRYVLFIIEKYGNAAWLLKEMKLVK